jgi:hypothetical protein
MMPACVTCGDACGEQRNGRRRKMHGDPNAKTLHVEDSEMGTFDLLFTSNLIGFAVPYGGSIGG